MSKIHDTLVELAFQLGAEEAKVVAADKVIVEDRVLLKCRFGCDGYGTNQTCPPYTPTPDAFRKILTEYEHVLLAKFRGTAKASEVVAKNLFKNLYCGNTPPKIKEQTRKFLSAWNRDKSKALEAVLELEKTAFNSGCALALGLRAASCNLCSECNINKPCKHPTMRRFPPESVGVNVVKTLHNAGMSISFPFKRNPNLVVMLLIS